MQLWASPESKRACARSHKSFRLVGAYFLISSFSMTNGDMNHSRDSESAAQRRVVTFLSPCEMTYRSGLFYSSPIRLCPRFVKKMFFLTYLNDLTGIICSVKIKIIIWNWSTVPTRVERIFMLLPAILTSMSVVKSCSVNRRYARFSGLYSSTAFYDVT